jgi:LEA14-like dessication related protein
MMNDERHALGKAARLALAGLSAFTLVACATLKPPTLQVESLKKGKLAITGAGLDIGFRVQNPNSQPMLIENFEYELKLNGRSLGRGYYSEGLSLDGFKSTRVDSRFTLNFLSLPRAVKEVLQHDRAKVEVDGIFYVREGSGLKKMSFRHDKEVDLKD